MRRAHAREVGIACVLAAGNHLVVAARDILTQMVQNNNLCIVKMNPCNDYVSSGLKAILAPLCQAGFIEIIFGGADVAQARSVAPSLQTLAMRLSHLIQAADVWLSVASLHKSKCKEIFKK
jgi:deoxyhypusine synthase